MPYALVIGIDQYSAPRISTLECAANDAVEMSQRLDAAGFDVVTLINEAATQKAISDELEGRLNDRVVDDDDPVLIYWAGHGLSDLREKANKDCGFSTFLLPFDADIERPVTSAFPVAHVWALLDQIKTRRLLVLLDTCFSGAFADGERGYTLGQGTRGAADATNDFLRMEGHGRIVISACGPTEVARESARQGHGEFTRSILSVLDREVDSGDRRIKVTALTSAIRDEVHHATRGAQTPSLYVAHQGADWSIPLPPPAPYLAPLPAWAFVGTNGGVGKTTLAMMTAELLAESGNVVLYLDADLAQFGGTSEWCQRAQTDIGDARTFADHVAAFSRAKTRTPTRDVSDRLLDVTPAYLQRPGCGRVLLLPATRPNDKVFAFNLVAEIKDRRNNLACQQILDSAFDRGVRAGATCIVIDCGAQFDPLSVNALAATHHPFIVAAARAGARDQREIILSNCAQTIEDFNRLRVETVVNRVPSRQALVQAWGEPGYGRGFRWLPFDRKLFQDWEEGRPNFELGYDTLSHAWHEILVASDQNGCGGLHRRLIPSEWDRFSKWALWLTQHPRWAAARRGATGRALRRTAIFGGACVAVLAVSLTSMILHIVAANPAKDTSFLPQWAAIGLVALSGLGVLGSLIGARLLRRRRRVLGEVADRSTSMGELKEWFSAPLVDGPWWKIWQPSRRAAIEWLHGQVVAERNRQLPSSAAIEV